jgi:hypothetical protein
VTDPFDTAGIRERVLAGWAAAPVRLREDANTEEDLALGGYRDRLIVELAQNAADAATRAGVPGVLALTLREAGPDGPVLVAANTGEALSADGVQSLATLRASAKAVDDGTVADNGTVAGNGMVGRFGVGFAAVLAVSDEPAVLSRSGGVRFSSADTAALVEEAAQQAPELAQEVRRRDGHLPVLRLPFAVDGEPPEGYDTAVVLPLRDETAADVVRAQLATLGDVLLLALPALQEVRVDVDGDVRVLRADPERWHVVRRSGTWTDDERAALLADRPTEERRQLGWSVLWALPADGSLPSGLEPVVRAPTPTDEPLSLPGVLLATLPLDPTRRHVASGPLADRIVQECAAAYAELLHQRALAGDDVTALVPTGLPAGAVDGALRERVVRLLPDVPLLRSVDGRLVRSRDAVTLDVAAADHPQVLAVLAPRVAGLVAAPPGARAALRVLGVEGLALADVVDALSVPEQADEWRRLYDGLAPLADDTSAREALGALPVLLADGRVVRGARGLMLPADARIPASALAALAPHGLRVVDPRAAHPLLERLGAQPVNARSVLDDPALRAAVAGSADADEPEELAQALLALVSVALGDGALQLGDLPWLADLALTDSEGDLAPAGALVLPGSFADEVLDQETVGRPAPRYAEQWSSTVLAVVGVLDGLAVVRELDVDLAAPDDQLHDLDGFADWADEVAGGAGVVAELSAVRDLDLVRPERWAQVLQHLATSPALRRALVEPLQVVRPDGSRRTVPSYTAWWLRDELGLAGTLDPTTGPVGSEVGSGAGEGSGLAELLDPAPEWLGEVDEGVRQALGLVGTSSAASLSDVDASLVELLLERLSDPHRRLGVGACLVAWRLLAQADLDDGPDGDASGTRALVPATGGPPGLLVSAVLPLDDAVVVDDPRWLQRTDLGGLVVPPSARATAVADLLDLPLCSDVAEGRVTSFGEDAEVLAAVLGTLRQNGCDDPPLRWVEHDELLVDGVAVTWWVHEGVPHAATSEGLARALAWSVGRWPLRHAIAALLVDPDNAQLVLLEDSAGGL